MVPRKPYKELIWLDRFSTSQCQLLPFHSSGSPFYFERFNACINIDVIRSAIYLGSLNIWASCVQLNAVLFVKQPNSRLFLLPIYFVKGIRRTRIFCFGVKKWIEFQCDAFVYWQLTHTKCSACQSNAQCVCIEIICNAEKKVSMANAFRASCSWLRCDRPHFVWPNGKRIRNRIGIACGPFRWCFISYVLIYFFVEAKTLFHKFETIDYASSTFDSLP